MDISLQKMASVSVIHILSIFLCVFPLALAQAPGFYVAAPNVIRLGEEGTVAIAHDGPEVQRVSLYLQDYPARKKRFSDLQFDVATEKPEIVRVRVRPEDIADAVFTNADFKNHVALVVQSGTFNKEVIIPVTSKSGYVFIQTDKPIYTPKEKVDIRIIPLNERTLPSQNQLKLQIRNPQNVIVKEVSFNKERGKAFISEEYSFPPQTLLGEWSISALYGSQFEHNSSITFQVAEYVLPTFSLKLYTPDVILPNDEKIKGSVSAVYVYGKKVKGYAVFKYSVRHATGAVVHLGYSKIIELLNGIADFAVSTNDLKTHTNIGWFPNISRSSFLVEATVTDFATGNKEVIKDHGGKFSDSPFIISFKRCLNDFKPGLRSVVAADITYVNGKPAAGIEAIITAVADENKALVIDQPMAVSDHQGRVSFLIHPEIQHTSVTVTVATNVPRIDGNQAIASHKQEKFISRNNAYIAISRNSVRTYKPLSSFAENIYMKPSNMTDVYFMVVSKGVILLMKKLPKGNFVQQNLQFQITYDMVPSFRLIVFAHYLNELIADSLNVDVSNECAPDAEVSVEPEFPNTQPGIDGHITIRGPKNALVGILAIDEAVYSLRNKDLLTKSKMFRTMESHDLGCGPGGGRSTNAVLGNAGVVMMTNMLTPSFDQTKVPACEEKVRRKREILSEMSQNYTGKERQCCKLGVMKHHSDLDCYERAAIVQQFESEESTGNCSAAFLDCCLQKQAKLIDQMTAYDAQKLVGDSLNFILDFIAEEDEDSTEIDTTVRSIFKETWLFKDKLIGPHKKEKIPASLPHSITTWVIQAVSVSDEFGMCVADPQSVVSFQNVFLQLNLPYSIVTNEQVEIQAVVFNYGTLELPVKVFMYGIKDICSGAQAGEKSEQKRIYVPPQSGNSVSFPIIPLNAGEYNIKVVALSEGGSDVVVKTLNVVRAGYTVEKSIVLKLDPTNQQKRKRRNSLETNTYSDFIDSSKNLQVSAIKISLPEEFIEGTASCVISVIGDEFGPTVETSIHDPEKLMILPSGCGEQNMMRLAPTLYTVRYLKVTGKMTNENEEQGYDYIRKGYEGQLAYRREDGSFSIYGESTPPSVWLTAFVMKVFCQANALIHIDPNVIDDGLQWLVEKQQPDGSFIDHNPVSARQITGGVDGIPTMTAFVLIALEECTCNNQRQEFAAAKSQAMSFLENHISELDEPLEIAIAAYALTLSQSDARDEALEKLQAIEIYDEDDLNTLHWETGHGTQDVHVTGYGLLTYLLQNDMARSNAIVNWLNTKRLASGSYASTQDTVIALQALSEYAMLSQTPEINLVTNITSSNDKTLRRSLVLNKKNALIQQYVELKKVGSMVFLNTEGYGVGVLAVKLKYNIPTPPEKLCKFEINLDVSEHKPQHRQQNNSVRRQNNDVFNMNSNLTTILGIDNSVEDDDSGNRRKRSARHSQNFRESYSRSSEGLEDALVRFKRESNHQNSAVVYYVNICVKYLGEHATDMAIVDVGIFSGFEAMEKDLKQLVDSNNHLIDKFEKTSRSVIFYLDQIPTQDYCFDFRIKQEYFVGKTQMSVVRVYDYYNPEESCTQFYAPVHTSPKLNRICNNKKICQCVEGGCPSKNPFAKVKQIESASSLTNQKKNENARIELMRIACNKNIDYVWMGKPTDVTRLGGFLHIRFHIKKVLKGGIEKGAELIESERELSAKDNCETAELITNRMYLIMGKDGERYMDEDGNFWYRYLLDSSSVIYKWYQLKYAPHEFLQKALIFVEKTFPEIGCPD